MFGWIAGLGLKAVAGKALANAAGFARVIGKWIGGLDLVHLCLLIAVLFGAWQTIGRWSQHRHTSKVEKQLSSCTVARDADHRAYANAQAAAAQKNDTQIATVKAKQERITANVDASYQADLALLRAELSKRLPRQAQPAAAAGDASSTKAPDVSTPTSGPDDSTRVSIPTSLYVRGAELELQLERLQQWVAEQVAVDPNEAAKP